MAAEKAAHFTSTFEAKPSIFEIVAQNGLNATFHPALQKIAQFLTLCSPKNFTWLSEYYDETFLVLNGLLQYHYIKNHGSSFSEYFYSLQRASVRTNGLSYKQKQLSWVLLVILPYLRRKLEDKINLYRLESAEGMLKNDYQGFFKKLLIASHSTFEVSWGTWILVNYLRYMADQVDSQLPELKIINLKLVYSMEPQDVEGFWSALVRGQLSIKEISSGLFQNVIFSALEVGAFFTQFLQAWNNERSTYNITALPTPIPPRVLNEQYKGKCPVCLQNWKIPTLLPVSGYVFCFACILRHLRENERCPVTNLPARPLDVVRLYDAD